MNSNRVNENDLNNVSGGSRKRLSTSSSEGLNNGLSTGLSEELSEGLSTGLKVLKSKGFSRASFSKSSDKRGK